MENLSVLKWNEVDGILIINPSLQNCERIGLSTETTWHFVTWVLGNEYKSDLRREKAWSLKPPYIDYLPWGASVVPQFYRTSMPSYRLCSLNQVHTSN